MLRVSEGAREGGGKRSQAEEEGECEGGESQRQRGVKRARWAERRGEEVGKK